MLPLAGPPATGIENKVFSLPDEAQLAKYTTEISERVGDASLCLLSLSNPNWQDDRLEIDHHQWRWLSFRKLAELIRSALPSDNHSYEVDPMRHYCVETMRHYAEVVDLLFELAARVAVMNSNEPVRLPDDVKTALEDNRLMSSMEKFRASSIERCVKQALRAARIAQTKVETNMTRSKPLNEWFCPISNEPDWQWQAGWQLQNDQFRLAVRVKKMHEKIEGKKTKKQREDFAKHNMELFNFLYLDEKLGTVGKTTYPKSDERDFCHYEPDFVYCYKKVPNLTVSQLEAAAVAVALRLTS